MDVDVPGGVTADAGRSAPGWTGPTLPTWVLLAAAAACAAVAACLVGGVRPIAPSPAARSSQSLLVEGISLQPGLIELDLRNATRAPITVSQVSVDQAFWQHSLEPRTVGRRGRAQLTIAYPWEPGRTIPIFLLTTTGAEITHVITNPTFTRAASPRSGRAIPLGLALAIAPVVVALAGLALAARAADRWPPGIFRGVALAVVAALLLSGARGAAGASRAVSAFVGGRQLVVFVALAALFFALWARKVAAGRAEAGDPVGLGVLVAVAVGAHGFGQGLVVGRLGGRAVELSGTRSLAMLAVAAAGGAAVLGALSLRDRLPGKRRVVVLALVAGVPAAAGLLLGQRVGTAVWSAVGLAAGVGALAGAAWWLGRAWLGDQGPAVSSRTAAAVGGAFVATVVAAVAV